MPTDQTGTCHDIQAQLAAYALGEAEASSEVTAHLAQCADCQRTLHVYIQAARLLPYAAPQAAPTPDLRDRILAAAQTARTPAPAHQPGRRWTLPRWRWNRALSWGFACALMLSLLGWNIALQRQLNAQAQQLNRLSTQVTRSRENWQTMTQVLNTSDLRSFVLSGPTATGHFWASPQSTVACLVAEDLPDPGAGKVYQVWLVQGQARTPEGTFVPQNGRGWILIPIEQPLANYQAVTVTIEPQGGSTAPTGQDVLNGTLEVTAQRSGLAPTKTIAFTPYRDVSH